ncbi:MAG: hypothetical protein IJ111_01310 [Eggerthellaceae bacterium]|nr:hypothetical protein [Eggerthellaceae bacterium]
MNVTVVFDAVAAYDIDIPDEASRDEIYESAYAWLDENLALVQGDINDSEIAIKAVY